MSNPTIGPLDSLRFAPGDGVRDRSTNETGVVSNVRAVPAFLGSTTLAAIVSVYLYKRKITKTYYIAYGSDSQLERTFVANMEEAAGKQLSSLKQKFETAKKDNYYIPTVLDESKRRPSVSAMSVTPHEAEIRTTSRQKQGVVDRAKSTADVVESQERKKQALRQLGFTNDRAERLLSQTTPLRGPDEVDNILDALFGGTGDGNLSERFKSGANFLLARGEKFRVDTADPYLQRLQKLISRKEGELAKAKIQLNSISRDAGLTYVKARAATNQRIAKLEGELTSIRGRLSQRQSDIILALKETGADAFGRLSLAQSQIESIFAKGKIYSEDIAEARPWERQRVSAAIDLLSQRIRSTKFYANRWEAEDVRGVFTQAKSRLSTYLSEYGTLLGDARTEPETIDSLIGLNIQENKEMQASARLYGDEFIEGGTGDPVRALFEAQKTNRLVKEVLSEKGERTSADIALTKRLKVNKRAMKERDSERYIQEKLFDYNAGDSGAFLFREGDVFHTVKRVDQRTGKIIVGGSRVNNLKLRTDLSDILNLDIDELGNLITPSRTSSSELLPTVNSVFKFRNTLESRVAGVRPGLLGENLSEALKSDTFIQPHLQKLFNLYYKTDLLNRFKTDDNVEEVFGDAVVRYLQRAAHPETIKLPKSVFNDNGEILLDKAVSQLFGEAVEEASNLYKASSEVREAELYKEGNKGELINEFENLVNQTAPSDVTSNYIEGLSSQGRRILRENEGDVASILKKIRKIEVQLSKTTSLEEKQALLQKLSDYREFVQYGESNTRVIPYVRSILNKRDESGFRAVDAYRTSLRSLRSTDISSFGRAQALQTINEFEWRFAAPMRGAVPSRTETLERLTNISTDSPEFARTIKATGELINRLQVQLDNGTASPEFVSQLQKFGLGVDARSRIYKNLVFEGGGNPITLRLENRVNKGVLQTLLLHGRNVVDIGSLVTEESEVHRSMLSRSNVIRKTANHIPLDLRTSNGLSGPNFPLVGVRTEGSLQAAVYGYEGGVQGAREMLSRAEKVVNGKANVLAIDLETLKSGSLGNVGIFHKGKYTSLHTREYLSSLERDDALSPGGSIFKAHAQQLGELSNRKDEIERQLHLFDNAKTAEELAEFARGETDEAKLKAQLAETSQSIASLNSKFSTVESVYNQAKGQLQQDVDALASTLLTNFNPSPQTSQGLAQALNKVNSLIRDRGYEESVQKALMDWAARRIKFKVLERTSTLAPEEALVNQLASTVKSVGKDTIFFGSNVNFDLDKIQEYLESANPGLPANVRQEISNLPEGQRLAAINEAISQSRAQITKNLKGLRKNQVDLLTVAQLADPGQLSYGQEEVLKRQLTNYREFHLGVPDIIDAFQGLFGVVRQGRTRASKLGVTLPELIEENPLAGKEGRVFWNPVTGRGYKIKGGFRGASQGVHGVRGFHDVGLELEELDYGTGIESRTFFGQGHVMTSSSLAREVGGLVDFSPEEVHEAALQKVQDLARDKIRRATSLRSSMDSDILGKLDTLASRYDLVQEAIKSGNALGYLKDISEKHIASGNPEGSYIAEYLLNNDNNNAGLRNIAQFNQMGDFISDYRNRHKTILESLKAEAQAKGATQEALDNSVQDYFRNTFKAAGKSPITDSHLLAKLGVTLEGEGLAGVNQSLRTGSIHVANKAFIEQSLLALGDTYLSLASSERREQLLNSAGLDENVKNSVLSALAGKRKTPLSFIEGASPLQSLLFNEGVRPALGKLVPEDILAQGVGQTAEYIFSNRSNLINSGPGRENPLAASPLTDAQLLSIGDRAKSKLYPEKTVNLIELEAQNSAILSAERFAKRKELLERVVSGAVELKTNIAHVKVGNAFKQVEEGLINAIQTPVGKGVISLATIAAAAGVTLAATVRPELGQEEREKREQMKAEYSADTIASKQVLTEVQKERRQNLLIRATGQSSGPIDHNVINRAVAEVMARNASIIRSEVHTKDERQKFGPFWAKRYDGRT